MSTITEKTEIGRILAVHRVRASLAVTTITADRVRPDMLQQNEQLPACCYGVVSSEPWHDLEGAGGGAQSRVQFNAYALTREEADRLGAAIEDCLDGFAGMLGEGDEAVFVSDCMLDNDYPRVDPPSPGDNRWRYRRVKDFLVTHSKPLPTLQLL